MKLAIKERLRMMHVDLKSNKMQTLLQPESKLPVKKVSWRFMARLKPKRRKKERKRPVWHRSLRRSVCRDST